MKANELMIGDWVTGKKWRENPFKLTRINDNGKYYYGITSDETQVGPFLLEEIEPIPLTPEILEKNGFVLKEKEKGMYGVNIAPHYTRDDVPFEVFCDGEPFAIWFEEPVNIKFVHQLQHALRLCGIKKEIICSYESKRTR